MKNTNDRAKIIWLVLIVSIVTFIYRGVVFAPLLGVYNVVNGTGSEFHYMVCEKAKEEMKKVKFEELHNDKYIFSVDNKEVLCEVFCELSVYRRNYHHYGGIIPYHKEEDFAGPIYDENKQFLGNKMVFKFYPHNNKEFDEFSAAYLVTADENGGLIFEDFDIFDKRRKEHQEKIEKEKKEAIEKEKLMKKEEEDKKIRRVNE